MADDQQSESSSEFNVGRLVTPLSFCLILVALVFLGGAFLTWRSYRRSPRVETIGEPLLSHAPHDVVMEGSTAIAGNPCQDLYQYVCNNWTSAHGAKDFSDDVARSWERLVQRAVLKGLHGSQGARIRPEYAVQAVTRYHNSCLELLGKPQEALQHKVLRFLAAFNHSWGLLVPGEPTDETVLRLLLVLSLRFDLAPVVKVRLVADAGQSVQLQVMPARAPLPTDQLRDHGSPLLRWTNLFFRSTITIDEMTEMAAVLLDMLSRNEASATRGAIRSPEVLAHLATSLPAYVWTAAVRDYAPSPWTTPVPGVLVHSVGSVRSLLGVLLKPQYREQVCPFLVLQALASMLRLHLQNVAAANVSLDDRQQRDRERCLALSEHVLAPVWNILYAEAIVDTRASVRARSLLHEVRLRLRERVHSCHVLDGTSKVTADRKLAAVRLVLPRLGTRRPRDVPALGDNFLGNTLTALGFLQRARLSPDRLTLLTKQQSPQLRLGRDNELVVPAAQLRSPMASGLPFLDLATLGAQAAQQMLQSLGEHGRHVDDTGLSRDWWTDSTRQRMWEYVLCLRQVYLSSSAGGLAFADADVWDQLGAAALGLHTAFELATLNRPARQETRGPLTLRQRFFVRFCRSYCEDARTALLMNRVPGRWVCNAAAQHVPAFADIFDCPDDAPMTPRETCAGF